MNIIIPIAINLLLWAFSLLYLQRKIDRKISDKARLERIKEQINQLILELDQTTDRNIQLLEHRIEELKSLVEGSSKEIRMLQNQKEEYTQAMEKYRELGRRENPLRHISEPAPEPEPVVIENKEEIEELSMKEQVLRSYKQGLKTDQISSELGIPKGEVELIITMSNLRR